MLIINNKIIECTEEELFDYYLFKEFDLLYPFNIYKNLVANNGTRIIEVPNEF